MIRNTGINSTQDDNKGKQVKYHLLTCLSILFKCRNVTSLKG